MPLRPEYALGHSASNDFLFAAIGDGEHGMPITVLSALTRLGLDPWEEAARLAGMTGEAAARSLAATLTALPESHRFSDPGKIAARLVASLPGAREHHDGQPNRAGRPARKARSGRLFGLICVVFAALLLLVSWTLWTDHATTPAPSTVSSIAR